MLLKRIRVVLALVFILGITLLFTDLSGIAHTYLGWMAKIQFLPALLALNVGVIVGLIVLTLIFGRVYCSVICPLGVMQDFFGLLGKRAKKNRYSFSPARNILRYAFLVIAIAAGLFGMGSILAVLAPYSAYGRIASSFISPIWVWLNNLLASWAESHDSYLFHYADAHPVALPVVILAAATLIILAILAWRNGRTYCNTVCPVGTVLGFISRFSLLRPVIDTTKCNGCGLCARNCKAACINSKEHTIDYSRCVACMDCLTKCHKGAISYARRPAAAAAEATDAGRRQFLTVASIAGAAAAVKAADKIVDGGMAAIEDKRKPVRRTLITPPGSRGANHLTAHCTACQLCIAECPNGVLRPSTALDRLLQPEASYELGYCRPECTRCSDVCPAGAILPITTADKSAIQIGRAVWVSDLCIPLTDGVECGNCARHCPVGAILMVLSDPSNPESPKIPVVNEERCIGCGACENLCPARPFSAIYVEGNKLHRTI